MASSATGDDQNFRSESTGCSQPAALHFNGGGCAAASASPGSPGGGSPTPAEVAQPPTCGATRTVLIVGATGRQGGAVLRALLAANAAALERGSAAPWAPVALTRDPSSAEARRLAASGVAVQLADSNSRPSLDAALAVRWRGGAPR